jgi:hypothetical protein
MLRNKIALTAAGFVAGVAMTVATIGSTVTPAAANPANQMDAGMMAAQKAQVIATTYQLDTAKLHDVEEQSRAGTILPGALGYVRRARIAAQATDWPDGLRPMATDLVVDMKVLEEAIRTEDASKVVEPATKVHDGGHDLSAAVYTWLDTGKAPEAGDEHSH